MCVASESLGQHSYWEREDVVFSFPAFQLTILKLDWQKTQEQTWLSCFSGMEVCWGDPPPQSGLTLQRSRDSAQSPHRTRKQRDKVKKSIREENSPSVSHVSCSWLKSWKRSADRRGETSREVILYVLLDVNKMHSDDSDISPGLTAMLGGGRRAEVKKEESFQTTVCSFFFFFLPSDSWGGNSVSMYFLLAAINSLFKGPFPCDFCTNTHTKHG